ncbi:PP2C family protein-serine/threonine phosphatase [Ramlibacter sp. MMS24-I3-19]|uniref:PP2C family protein-serine/threonine phosphatase n=1 Tax=Ramlibacter sp. MMS24-I3-19 TaxID=3416606 RepID=UPI003D03947E
MSAETVNPPIRALLVDDDPLLLALLSAFLASRGYGVVEAADGEQALQHLADGGFNLVVTDRHMPRMDGLDLCRAIRARGDRNYVYCIMLTASGDEQALQVAMEAGVDDFLAKPLRPADLGARLRAAERVLALEAGLAARNQELSQAYAQLSRDLELARALQRGQLPAPQAFGSLRFEGWFEASSYVGGDLYDYFALGDRLLGFYLADVSGHGVAAAMMAVAAQHQLRTAAQQVVRAVTPDIGLDEAALEIVYRYNARFMQSDESGLYLTLVFGLVDRTTGQVALVGAGHPPALHAAPGEREFTAIGEGSVPIGILPEPDWQATLHTLAPGSRLVLHSDGIVDCEGADGSAFGAQRLRELLERERDAPAAATCAAVRDALRGWHTGSFGDDVTLLVLEAR